MEGVARKQPDFSEPVHRCHEFLTAGRRSGKNSSEEGRALTCCLTYFKYALRRSVA